MITNPNSAVQRIQNHLAYKLGQALIDFKHNGGGGGYLSLFKKLYQITRQHTKEQKIYQQTIQVFPQLKYPDLEQCSDYNQALRYKFHLSYFLGEIFINSCKNWHKGAGFKLNKNIKKANEEFKTFKEIFKGLDVFHPNVPTAIINNKQFLLKNFSQVKNILHIHRNYPAIINNIFHNFTYFVENFSHIEKWLLSSDFKQRYKDKNHPYPSLIDPKNANYHHILAKCAWDINLPLPYNYEFIWLASHGTGTYALKNFLYYNQVLVSPERTQIETGFEVYQNTLNFLLEETKEFKKAICVKEIYFEDFHKFCSLIQKKVKFIFQTRDYFEIFACFSNHRARKEKALMEFNLKTDLNEVFERFHYITNGGENFPAQLMIKNLPRFSKDKGMIRGCILEYSMLEAFDNVLEILYIDMKDICEDKVQQTMKNICNFLNLNYQENKNYQDKAVNNDDKILFPLTLDISTIKHCNNVKLIIIAQNETFDKELYQDISDILHIKSIYRVLILKEHTSLLSHLALEILSNYFSQFSQTLSNKLDEQVKNRIKAMDYVKIYKIDKNIREELRTIINYEITHLKQHSPHIIASWKYYQEFEKMCQELDG